MLVALAGAAKRFRKTGTPEASISSNRDQVQAGRRIESQTGVQL